MHRLAKKQKSGFSFIEVIVVIGIIAMFASIVLMFLGHMAEQSARQVCLENMRAVDNAYSIYVVKSEKGLAQDSSTINFLVDNGYLVAPPSCPSHGVYSCQAGSDNQLKITCSVHGALTN